MAFMKVHNNKGESRLINTVEIAHTYEEKIQDEMHYFVALKTGTILPVTKEYHEKIEEVMLQMK